MKQENENKIPLCVDLDGTLLLTDTLIESLLSIAAGKPWMLIYLVYVLICYGKARFKEKTASVAFIDMALLPCNEPFIDWLHVEHRRGRYLVLATASDRRIAEAAADHFGIFSEVIGSDGTTNFKGAYKADELDSRFGREQFDYAGDSSADLAVWKHTRAAVVIGNGQLVRKAQKVSDIAETFPGSSVKMTAVFRSMRLHQWSKNLLIFLPLITAHQMFNPASLAVAVTAFILFSLNASAVYIVNDLLDLASDRQHPVKKYRPLASGELPVQYGVGLSLILLACAWGVGIFFMPPAFNSAVGVYLAVTFLYSLRLKNVAPIDVLILAMLYTIRVIAGGAAVALFPSFWLLAFSMFLFFSLALLKRHSELLATKARDEDEIPGRNWRVSDLSLIGTLGVSSGISSILVLALYIDSEQARQIYTAPYWLWLACPLLLFWISNIWLQSFRGKMHADPVVFALSDWSTWMVGLAVLGIAILAKIGITL